MSALTTGLSAYGKFRTYSGAFVVVIVAMSACVLGAYMIKNPDKHTATATGTVKEATMSKDPNGNSIYTILAEYSVSGRSFSASGQTETIYNKGQTITVYYDPANPGDYTLRPYPSWTGWAIIGGATLIAAISVGFAYFFSGLSNTGKAAVGGLEATGNAMRFLSSN